MQLCDLRLRGQEVTLRSGWVHVPESVLVREQVFVDIAVLEQHLSVTKQVEKGGEQGPASSRGESFGVSWLTEVP